MIGRLSLLSALMAPLLATSAQGRADEPAVLKVEPAELMKHPEWVGREVEVDDRVRFFQGKDFEELLLKRTEVVFRLPARFRPRRNDEIQAARVRGILKREGRGWICEVKALTPLPRDPERLEQGTASLPANDAKSRHSWAVWARRRGEDFHDEAMTARARQLESEAIRIEAERPPADDPGGHWLRLARRARDWPLPEPEPSILAHRAFRVLLERATTAADADRLIEEIEGFFSKARDPASISATAEVSDESGSAEEAYRGASPERRAALDRALLADAIEKSLAMRAAEPGADALDLADSARRRLPDRPEVADRLEDRAVEEAFGNIGPLRKEELEALAGRLEGRGQPDRARDLRRLWLDDQREHRLSESDAEGRVLLAEQYAELHDDRGRETARQLLLEAREIDPSYREPEETLRRLGFRKSGEDWVDPAASRPVVAAADGEAGEETRAGSTGRPLYGLTRREVEARLGKPNRVSRSASQGLVVEQWIYRGLRGTQYINFLRRPTMMEATVDAYYSLP